MKKYHVFSAKNFGYESDLGDGTYDYFVFPAEEFSESDGMGLFVEVTKYTRKNNNEYPYTAYEQPLIEPAFVCHISLSLNCKFLDFLIIKFNGSKINVGVQERHFNIYFRTVNT